MATLLTLLIFLGVGYLIVTIISRKKRELAEKESFQRDQFLKESRLLLKVESPSFSSEASSTPSPLSSAQDLIAKVINHFSTLGYKVGDFGNFEGIDIIGLKEKELLLVYCDTSLKEVSKKELKDFIADCTIYVDKNPMLSSRTVSRVFATRSKVSIEALTFLRTHSESLNLLDTL